MTKQIRNDRAIRLVAEGLKMLRKERGLLQVAVVKDTGLNIGRIEAAMVNISISSIDKLCRYYGVTLEEFFNRIYSEPIASS